MRNLLAAGWLLLATLAFWLAYWSGESGAALFRIGMVLYALLLALTLVVVAREWLSRSRRGSTNAR